jgi:hypothetical protein
VIDLLLSVALAIGGSASLKGSPCICDDVDLAVSDASAIGPPVAGSDPSMKVRE